MRSMLCLAVTGLTMGLIMSACETSRSAESARGWRYPPSFDQVSQTVDAVATNRMRATMWKLAIRVGSLRAVLKSQPADSPDHQPRVVAELADLLAAAEDIEPHLEQLGIDHAASSGAAFRAELRAALRGAERPVPNYVFAERVASGCIYCHR